MMPILMQRLILASDALFSWFQLSSHPVYDLFYPGVIIISILPYAYDMPGCCCFLSGYSGLKLHKPLIALRLIREIVEGLLEQRRDLVFPPVMTQFIVIWRD